jgi:hypothetical protein
MDLGVAGMASSVASPGKRLAGWLVETGIFEVIDDETGKRPLFNLTWLGHAVIAGSVVLLGSIYYAATLGSVYVLKDSWRICQSSSGVSPSSVSPSSISLGQGLIGSAVAAAATSQATEEPQKRLVRQRARLDKQKELLAKGAEDSCSIAIFYFANRIAVLSLSSAAGIVFVVCLAITSKDGWGKTNNAIINTGAVAGLVLFTMTIYSQLYGQGTNYESYRLKYVIASDTRNMIESAIANGSILFFADATGSAGASATTNPPTEVNLDSSDGMTKLIRYVDDKLALVNRPEFNVDSSFVDATSAQVGTFLKTKQQEPNPATSGNSNQAPAR